jgi:hypothetical protein
MMELDRELSNMSWTYYDAAAVYAMKGETEKAIANLESLISGPGCVDLKLSP